MPSYLDDNTDFLNSTPFSGLLFTVDFTSLYTNISHNEGIEAFREVCDSRTIQHPSAESLLKFLEHVLKLNNFMFNGEHKWHSYGHQNGSLLRKHFYEKIKTQPAPWRYLKTLSWLRFTKEIGGKPTMPEYLQNVCQLFANFISPFVNNEVTSIVTRRVWSGRSEENGLFR